MIIENIKDTNSFCAQYIEEAIDDSLKRMQLEKIDLVLLHCPPTEVYNKDEIFEKLSENGIGYKTYTGENNSLIIISKVIITVSQ